LVSLTSAIAGNTIIDKWEFEGSLDSTVSGIAASTVGGTTSDFAASGDGFGLSIADFAPQSSGSGTRGVEFRASTLSYSNITVSFDHRALASSVSRWAQVDYTLNGIDWIPGFWNNNGGLSTAFNNFNIDFSSIIEANNNTNFGFRIVSIFSPLAFDQNIDLDPYGPDTGYMRVNSGAVYSPDTSTAGGAYSSAASWGFDNVSISGIPEPSALSLLAVGLGGLAFLRRRRS